MADLLPSSPDPSVGDGGDPRVIGVDSDDADDLLAALQSETARDVLGVLYDEPATPSGLAEEVDTSIQNVRYHLDKLADADLVEVADTVYSEKGREMKVYAPAAKPLVVFAGNDDETTGIEAALSRLLGGLGILGLSSLAVQRIFGSPSGVGDSTEVYFQGDESGAATTASQDAGADDQSVTFAEEDDDSVTLSDSSENATDGGATTTQESPDTTQEAADTTRDAADTTQDAADTTVETTEATQTAEEATRTTQSVGDDATTVEEAAETTVAEEADTIQETTRTLAETTTEEAAQSTTTVADAAGSAVSGLPPGLLFFAGGLVVLLAFGLAWYLRGR